MLDRKIAPQIKDAIDFTYVLPKLSLRKADNNIPIYYLNAGSQEVVQIDWVFEGGLWHDEKPGVAHSVAALIKNGTALHNEFQISEAIEYYGASLKVIITNDFTHLSLSTLTKHLNNLLPIVHEVITMATFPEEELAIHKQNAIQALKVRLLQCDFVANRLIDSQVWGKAHPYGRYTETIDIEALNREDLVNYYDKIFRSDNCKIFASGYIKESDIELIHNYFGSSKWKCDDDSNILQINHPVLASSVMSMHYDNDASGKQAAVRLAREFVHRTHEDFVPFQLLNAVLGGYFGSRLMSNIREDKGYTYGIYSYIGSFRYNSMIAISSEVDRDKMELTIDECFKEMKLLQEELIPEDELLLVKNYLLGGLLGDLDGPFSIMRFWKTIILNDMKEEDFYNNVTVYKHTTSQELLALAQKYLRPEDYYKVTVI